MRKDFRDFIRQCDQCQANKESNTLPDGDAQTLPFPSEIFSSYAIDFMGPFTKLKGQDSVLVVVDRAVTNLTKQGRFHMTKVISHRYVLVSRYRVS